MAIFISLDLVFILIVGLGMGTASVNFFIIYPMLAIVFSNSFFVFFERHKNRVSKIFLYILIMAIVINGSLYLFPTNIDNKLLNKEGLDHSDVILSPYNYSVDDNFTINAVSALIKSSFHDERGGKRIFVQYNRLSPAMDSISLYAFLEKGLYIDYSTPQVLPTGEYYFFIEKGEEDCESRIAIAKEYHLLKKLMYGGEPFYIFKKNNHLR